MSEAVEIYRGMKDFKKALRAMYGRPCPDCERLLPRANPSILLPEQRCRIHGYRDHRPELTQADYDKVSNMNTETETASPVQKIALNPVESSQIHAIGHDAETSTLAIQFKSKGGPGSTYHYANFSAEKFAAFKGAESIGSYFGQHIKPATTEHPFTRIG